MSDSEVFDVLRRVDYGGRQLWAATPPPGPAQDMEGTGPTREAALLDLVHKLAAQRPRPQVSVNVVIDATKYSPSELDQVLAKVRELEEGRADVR